MPEKAITSGYDLSVQYDDVSYKLGQKDPTKGRIDCSGWVVYLQNKGMAEINATLGTEAFKDNERFSPGFDSAAAIIKKTHDRHGTLATNQDIRADMLKEGMLIGEDNGPTKFDKGRYEGIDHIVQVVRNPKTGELAISQSRGGEGVELTSVDTYLARKQGKGVELHLVDPWQGVRPQLEQAKADPINASTPAHQQLAPALEQAGYSDEQIDRIATQAYRLGTQQSGQPERFMLHKNGSSIGILDAFRTLKEFSINELMGKPQQAIEARTEANSNAVETVPGRETPAHVR